MKTGKDLKELLAEVIRQDEAKRDYLAPTQKTELFLKGDEVRVGIKDRDFPLTPHCHAQVAVQAEIPKPYYDRLLKDAPDLLATNVNRWFTKFPAVRMWRTLDGTARANLSDRYRCLDNNDYMQAALPRLMKLGVQVMSSDITSTRLHLKVVDQRIAREIGLGQGHNHFDRLCPALTLRNSEIGQGRLELLTSVYTSGCTNMMVINEKAKRQSHLGKRNDLTDEEWGMLSSETRKLTDQAFWHQIGDLVEGSFERARFDAIVDKLHATTENAIEADPVKVIEVTATKFGLNEDERNGVLKHFLASADFTQYGLHAAVTRAAEDIESYDRASEFELLGGKIIELPRADWSRIATAKPVKADEIAEAA
jgi:hypothetical protein